MDLAVDLASWACIVVGGVFAVIGGIGILRLPDFYTRVHAAGITDTLAAGLLILGLMFQAGLSLVTVKLLLVFVFLLFTSPTSTHALTHAALSTGHEPLLHGKDGEPPSEEDEEPSKT